MKSSSCVHMTWTNLYKKISLFQKLGFELPRYELTSHQEFGLDWSSDIATKQGKINIPYAQSVKITRLPQKIIKHGYTMVYSKVASLTKYEFLECKIGGLIEFGALILEMYVGKCGLTLCKLTVIIVLLYLQF